jgi:hypothetical protein
MLIASLIDLPTHLHAELARMRAKHGPATDTGPASLSEVANEHTIDIEPDEMDFVDGRKWTPDAIREAAAEQPFHYTDRMERIVLGDYKEGNGL